MTSDKRTEHFVTLFDSHYLPLGLSLYRSLEDEARPFHLWIVAMDEACGEALEKMELDAATVVRLRELENEALLAIKPGRSLGEYCWTLTPFLPAYVLQRRPELERVTYVDADLFFFRSPKVLLDEFVASGKHVLITEHAFAPEHAGYARYGRFCVQFMTFRSSEPASRVLRWWQQRCLEWCYAREEDGKFGDQKYLDDWPQRFSEEVHILSQTDRTVAPWNVAHLSRRSAMRVDPVFYHFHSLKIVSRRRVVPYYMYYIGKKNRWIYDRYMATLKAVMKQMRTRGIPVIGRPLYGSSVGWAHAGYTFARTYLSGKTDWAIL
jgi:hypothetical protein